ncbi:hypothetical protein INT43_004714 [Umbelopsis isabellina]|uniref:Membrane anchor Opy2 N-terminal domain-containing protein n=1 Tax=Mortierella isabellina TaxID=91625 RepID=A0A8H7PGB3_MORIS|nr:hypothetical protein INT43_004714 [Umbelopsis isabellina]
MLPVKSAMTMLVIIVAILMAGPKVILADPTSVAAAASPSSSPPSQTSSSQNCVPANCVTSCNPACSSNMVCVVPSMSQCRVCPVPICVAPGAINAPTSSSGSSSGSSGSNAALLPGLIGGLIGLLVLAAIAFSAIRYKRRKAQGLPFWKSKDFDNESSESWGRPGAQSAVVPIAYMPPSTSHTRTEMQSTSSGPNTSIRNSLALTTQNDYLHQPTTPHSNASRYSSMSENPFADLDDESTVQLKRVVTLRKTSSTRSPPENNSLATFEENDDDDQSVASSVANVVTRNNSQSAVQMQRARPQLMRINTIKIDDGSGLKRSGSVRTMLTPESGSSGSLPLNSLNRTDSGSVTNPTQSSTSLTAVKAGSDDNPFHDRHSINGENESDDYTSHKNRSASVATTGSQRTNITDSVMSGAGDGEITIFWDGNGSSSKEA